MPSEDLVEHSTQQEISDSPSTPEGLTIAELSSIDRAEIDSLKAEGISLRETAAVIDALECTILYNGWQTVVDTYGADAVLEIVAAKEDNGLHDMADFFKKIEPDTAKRNALLDTIDNTNSEHLYDQINEKANGVVNASHSTGDNVDRGRSFHVQDLKSGEARFVEDDVLFSIDLPNVLDAHPDLVAQFKESGDLITLLGSLREQYNRDLETYVDRFESVQAQLEELIGNGERETRDRSGDIEAILSAEIVAIEEKLNSNSDDVFSDMLRSMLDQRAVEVEELREKRELQIRAVRSGIYDQLGLTDAGLSGYRPTRPSVTEPVYIPK